MELGYMDGTMTKGDLSFDFLHFDNEGRENQQMFYFGCGYANAGQPLGNDGIAGFGRHNLALHSQLATVFPNKFAHCFVPPRSKGQSTFTIGAAPANILYTPMLSPAVGIPGFYYVQMIGIDVGGQALAIDPVVFNVAGGGTIVDSGSNLAFLTRIAMDQVIAAYRAQVNLPVKLNWGRLQMPLCFDTLLVEVMPKLPGLTFKFPGASLYVAPEAAFRRFEGNAHCLAMKYVEQGQFSVIGNMFMQNTIVVYDNEVGQIGFAPWNCLTPY